MRHRQLGLPGVDERALERQRVALTRDVTRRLGPVCAGLHMTDARFRAIIDAIVEVKLGWVRRQLPP